MLDTVITDQIGATGLTVLGVVVVAGYSAVGLLAVWGAWGRPNWSVRIALVGVVIALTLLIPAYELFIIFLTQSVVVIVPLMLARRRLIDSKVADLDVVVKSTLKAPPDASLLQRSVIIEEEKEKGAAAGSHGSARLDKPTVAPLNSLWPTLPGAVALAVVAAIVIAGAARMPYEVLAGWPVLIIFGCCFGALTLIAAMVVFGEIPLWFRMLLCVSPSVAPVLLRIFLWLSPSVESVSVSQEFGEISLWFQMFLWLIVPLPPMVVWLASARTLGYPIRIVTTRPLVKRLAQLVVVLVSAAIILLTAAAYYDLATPAPIPRDTLPEPNGYDELVSLGKTLENVEIPGAGLGAYKALDAFVEEHAEVFRTARAALDRRCMVPVEYESFEFPFQSQLPIYKLGRAFLAEGKLAELNGHTNVAAVSYLDAVRLGHAVTHGGLFIHLMVGWAVENTGIRELNALKKWLTADRCRKLIDALMPLDDGTKFLEEGTAREKAWCDRSQGWKGRLNATLYMIENKWKEPLATVDRAGKYRLARLRLLIGELAIRAYRLEHDEEPLSLAELAPKYLPAVPEDPFSGKPLIYRPDPIEHIFYSIGPDGHDDGGRPLDVEQWSGDVLLNMPRETRLDGHTGTKR